MLSVLFIELFIPTIILKCFLQILQMRKLRSTAPKIMFEKEEVGGKKEEGKARVSRHIPLNLISPLLSSISYRFYCLPIAQQAAGLNLNHVDH